MTNKGYQVKEYHCPVKRYCQTMDLKDNPKLIKEYIRCHSKPEAWPFSRYFRDGNLYIRFPVIHDYRNTA